MIYYLGLINIVGYLLMMVDKKRAIKHEWRISEKALFTCAICFGSYGVWCGMQRFRHKTKHQSFKMGIPCLMILQTLILFAMFK